MDRLELHDSLRIVVPGILLAFILNSYFDFGWMTKSGVASLLGFGVFLGLIMSALTFKSYRRWFESICRKYGYSYKLHRIFKNKLRLYSELNDEQGYFLSKRKATRCARGHYSDKYNDGALFSFRMPKTFALMHFNLMAVYIITAIMVICDAFFLDIELTTFSPSFYIELIVILFLLLISLRESNRKFTYSLEKELEYWRSRDINEVAVLVINRPLLLF